MIHFRFLNFPLIRFGKIGSRALYSCSGSAWDTESPRNMNLGHALVTGHGPWGLDLHQILTPDYIYLIIEEI